MRWLSLLLILLPANAFAQQLLLGGGIEAGSGIAGGGEVARMVRRSRTTLRLSVDGRNDETPKTAYSAGILTEIEPRAGLALDAHVMRLLGTKIWTGAGLIGFVAPKTLIGVSAFGAYHYPLSTGMTFTAGPAFQVFAIGADLPSAQPIWQLTLRIGIHVEL